MVCSLFILSLFLGAMNDTEDAVYNNQQSQLQSSINRVKGTYLLSQLTQNYGFF